MADVVPSSSSGSVPVPHPKVTPWVTIQDDRGTITAAGLDAPARGLYLLTRGCRGAGCMKQARLVSYHGRTGRSWGLACRELKNPDRRWKLSCVMTGLGSKHSRTSAKTPSMSAKSASV